MIRIYANRSGDRCRLFITGHAEGGEERRVICAGVSALAGALVLHAAKYRHARYRMASGEVFLSCPHLGEGFELVMNGLCEIAKSYPDQVEIMQYSAVDDKIETM